MMLKRLLLRGDNKGIGAVEFALIAPVLIAFVVGISQMGKLFFANADMKNAMAHGARAASVWPVPENDADIKAVVNERLARTGALAKAKVDIVRGVENGNNFIDIEMTYQVPVDFIVYDVAPITLKDTRRVYVQMLPQSNDGSTSTTSASTTSATSAGGTTSSTSATSASSTGGSTSATSASSTTSSTTSASTTSSGNGNSNGNSNHGHGDCKKKC